MIAEVTLPPSPLAALREQMSRDGFDAMLIGPSPAFRHLVGRAANLTERLIALVVTQTRVELVVPRLQAPLYSDYPFELQIWDETKAGQPEAIELLAQRLIDAGATHVGVNLEFWSGFLLRLIAMLPEAHFAPASDLDLIRAIKSPEEAAGLEAAAAAIDRVWAKFVQSHPVITGLSENQIRDWLMGAMTAEGFSSIAWVDVGAGANGASSLHHGSDHRIQKGEAVVIDYAGLYQGWNGDICRVICAGDPGPEYRAAYELVLQAQEAAFQAIQVGAPAEAPDRAARALLSSAGMGDYFSHRVGHGIGMDVHEEPYLVEGNSLTLCPGMVMSDEPGLYFPEKWGIRIEDIILLEATGPRRLTQAPKDLLIHL